MSMTCDVFAIDTEQLAGFIAEPELVKAFLYSQESPVPAEGHVDLDKAWHGIHFVLNGAAWEGEGELGLTVLGGQPLGDELVYGPPLYLTPQQVADVARVLQPITPEQFASRFDAQALSAAEVYPDIWDEEEPEELLDYVGHFYGLLRDLYLRAAEQGKALLKVVH